MHKYIKIGVIGAGLLWQSIARADLPESRGGVIELGEQFAELVAQAESIEGLTSKEKNVLHLAARLVGSQCKIAEAYSVALKGGRLSEGNVQQVKASLLNVVNKTSDAVISCYEILKQHGHPSVREPDNVPTLLLQKLDVLRILADKNEGKKSDNQNGSKTRHPK